MGFIAIAKGLFEFVVWILTCGKIELFPIDPTQVKEDPDGLRVPINPVSKFNISSTHLDSAISRRNLFSKSNIDYTKPPFNIDFSKIELVKEYIPTNNHEMIYTCCLIPKTNNDNSIKGMIFYHHGYASHSSWTEIRIGKRYCELGYIFVMHDYYGHGQSDGKWMYLDSFDRIVDDAQFVVEWGKKKYSNYLTRKDSNYFLMGQSMGGGVALLLSLRYSKKTMNGLILMSPMIQIDPSNAPNPTIGKIFEKLLHLMPFIGNLLVLPGRRLTPYNSRILLNNQFIVDNPLYFNYRPRLKTAWTIKCACDLIESKLSQVELSLLICHGNGDQITNIDGSKSLYKQAKSRDKELKIYQNAYHLLPLDIDANNVYDDVDAWITKRCHT